MEFPDTEDPHRNRGSPIAGWLENPTEPDDFPGYPLGNLHMVSVAYRIFFFVMIGYNPIKISIQPWPDWGAFGHSALQCHQTYGKSLWPTAVYSWENHRRNRQKAVTTLT